MSTPLFCPVCDFVMGTLDDAIAYQENQCCLTCQNQWGKEVDYSKKESLPKLKEYLEKRISQTKTILPILRFD